MVLLCSTIPLLLISRIQAPFVAVHPYVSTRLFALEMTIVSVRNCLGDINLFDTKEGGEGETAVGFLAPLVIGQ